MKYCLFFLIILYTTKINEREFPEFSIFHKIFVLFMCVCMHEIAKLYKRTLFNRYKIEIFSDRVIFKK